MHRAASFDPARTPWASKRWPNRVTCRGWSPSGLDGPGRRTPGHTRDVADHQSSFVMYTGCLLLASSALGRVRLLGSQPPGPQKPA